MLVGSIVPSAGLPISGLMIEKPLTSVGMPAIDAGDRHRDDVVVAGGQDGGALPRGRDAVDQRLVGAAGLVGGVGAGGRPRAAGRPA